VTEETNMADLPRDPDTTDDTDVRRDPRSTTGTPRWVKVSVITAIVVALLVILMLSGVLGEHGPGRHTDLTGGYKFSVGTPWR